MRQIAPRDVQVVIAMVGRSSPFGTASVPPDLSTMVNLGAKGLWRDSVALTVLAIGAQTMVYAGQQGRDIKTLSQQETVDRLAGRAWAWPAPGN